MQRPPGPSSVLGGTRSDLFNAARLAPGQVDAELLRGTEDVLVGIAHLDGHAVAREHLDVEAQRLHLLDQHLEGLRNARLRYVLALDDGLVDLHPAEHVVGLDGEQLLQRVSGAVRLERPDLHLTEPLAAELHLTAERLLSDHGIRAGRPCMDLVVDQVEQLQYVDVTDGDRVLERLAGAAVEHPGLAAGGYEAVAIAVGQGGTEQPGDLLLPCTVEHRGGDPGPGWCLIRADLVQPLAPRVRLAVDLPAGLRDPPQVGLEHLTDVHAARHAERVQHDVHRRAVLKERHVLGREDLGDDALVAVAARQLVTIGDLPLLRHVDAHKLVHTRGKLVAVLSGEDPDADDLALFAVRDLQRRVAHLARLLAEDGTQQPLLRSQLGLALRGDLADQDVTGDDFGADPDDAALVEVGEHFIGDVWYVSGDFLRPEL